MSDINNMNVGVRWYVVHTYSGYENKVMTSLQKMIENRGLGDMIFDIRIPVQKVIEQKVVKNKKDGTETTEEVEKELKLFPSYVYVKMIMTDASWHVVRNITGVTGFVGPGSRPTPLTDAEVAALMFEETKVEIRLSFEVGSEVTITAGLFEGLGGTVQSISDDKKTVTVLIKRGRRDMPVEISSAEVSPVN